MSTIGKNVKNRRKKDSASDRRLAVDFNGNVQFMHKMSGGETEFDLTALTLPLGAGAFTNPTPETIRGINLSNVRKRIKLFNGEGKSLGPAGLEWEVIGTKIILKNTTAGVDEIFFGEIKNVPRQNIAFFDGKQNTITGFLTPGETQFNLGFSVPLGDIDTSNDRIGPCDVHRQREIQYLNTDFTTADVSADGDYAYIDDGQGEASVIEFNTPGAVLPGGLPEFISVKRNQISVDKEDGSLRQEMDVLGGAVDRLVDEVSIIQSIPKSDLLNFNPTRQQLRQFGDEIFAALVRLVALETYQEEFTNFSHTESNVASNTDRTFSGIVGTKDTKGGLSGDRYTFQRNGSFVLLWRAAFGNTSSAFRSLNYTINDGPQTRILSSDGISSTTTTLSAIELLNVNAGDYIKFILRQATGSPESIVSSIGIFEKGNTPLL